MDRPYIICHMLTSLDGKVTGEFLNNPICKEPCEVYYKINRELKSDGFICGRVTMQSSFTGGWYPNLNEYKPVNFDCIKKDYIIGNKYMSGFYAVAFDTNGKLGWKTNKIIDPDGDPGYDGAQIIEVLSKNVDERYLAYLQKLQIPYIFAGDTAIDVKVALFKLKNIFGIKTLLLEGGSIINGAFERIDAIDQLSLVVAPVVAQKDDKPLFMDAKLSEFETINTKIQDGVTVISCKKAYALNAQQLYGETKEYKEYENKTASYTKDKWTAVNDGLNAIFSDFADCKNSGCTANSSNAKRLVKRLQDYITENYYTCTDTVLKGLGKMYVADERFKANIDKYSNGTAEFVSQAIEIHCK